MTLLIQEPILVIIPSLANLIGQDEAILLQQLHFRLENQGVKREGELWYCQSYERWQKQIPFWGIAKIKKLFLKLEKMGLIISTSKYNTFYVDRTKWYRIDYEKLNALLCAHEVPNGTTNIPTETTPMSQPEPSQSPDECPSKRKDFKEKNKNVTYKKQAEEVIDYLNYKAYKAYNKTLERNQQPIRERLKEGFTVEDCKMVIDEQANRWLKDLNMNQFLRPITLFHEEKFESYLMSAMKTKGLLSDGYKPFVLNFNEGEDWCLSWLGEDGETAPPIVKNC